MLNEAVRARMRSRLFAAATLVMGCHGKAAPVHDVAAPEPADAAPVDAGVADAAPADAYVAIDLLNDVPTDAGRAKKAKPGKPPDAGTPFENIIMI